MTEARTLKIKTTLARQMAQPGGRTIADVERRANERLERHRDDVMTTIAGTITELELVVAAAAPDSEPQVYRLASSLLDTAGFFDTGPLYDAGYSLCDVADRMQANGAWNWPTVAVHVQAMRLILTGGCKADATTEALLLGLRSVAAKARQEA
ncbi:MULTISPECIES: chemotaxis protein CheE [unclassified Brevundimonas]|uniref:chemotaxis protein CheE n=1 Tax=unclassified Brevundimonas TaxID=2622653 RepID=UPI000CFDEDD3|nr:MULTISPECIES: chemotaxis protein CheE [unclassified Brevundimonas]PRA27765.1 chemotaxis protein CheE [Brevundimonas sp. MYb27]PQZ81074.1 chemotaxis protein CheE [Brevundimonas sp. MYb31]PRB15359.1 chemotaxis protein CheE [Brevundimonas sp. MYb52]PRB35718.1 chemotaxis protein CheE [Brevundimonas sp. MYb46]PRB42783.1 chemotaxis protein CheE [Brevundimonas sp. MYb33]